MPALISRRTMIPVLLGLAAAGVAAPAQAATCADADLIPSAASLAQARTATLCLLNEQRSARGLPALRASHPLQRAATAYSRRMVRERFFDHTAPDGTTFGWRIEAAGYGAFGSLAENIAWGSGSRGTPARIVDGWMHSPGHRHNILDARLRDIGVGIATGSPASIGRGAAATYTTDFGRRR